MVVHAPSTDWLPSSVIWPSPEARTYWYPPTLPATSMICVSMMGWSPGRSM
nr:hypothetical protein [Paracidovorax cattleyae]